MLSEATSAAATPPVTSPEPLLTVAWDVATSSLSVTISIWLGVAGVVVILLLWGWRWWRGGFSFRDFEIDQAEFGVGQSKFRFKPNLTDRQVAYAIWVELSTRKIGLPIDFDHDVITEIYDSWYNFFAITRDLVKSIPVGKVKDSSTQSIIRLSIEVLNQGLRPHLTQWQARFRHWYERELKKLDAGEGEALLDPQAIQARFPKYAELKADMERVNQSLIRYRRKMRQLVLAESNLWTAD